MSESVWATAWTMADSISSLYCRVKASAVTFSRPGMCAMSVANSLINTSWWRCRFETGSWGFEEGASKRLLVHVYAESVAFADVSKLYGCVVNR